MAAIDQIGTESGQGNENIWEQGNARKCINDATNMQPRK